MQRKDECVLLLFLQSITKIPLFFTSFHLKIPCIVTQEGDDQSFEL